MGSMGLGGRPTGWLFLLAALGLPDAARADDAEFRLVFDASAEGLAEEDVRAAVEKEVGRPVVISSDAASGDLVLLVDAGRLIVRYRTETGTVERYLPLPSEPNDVPLMVSLAAGNLVRDEREEIGAAKSTDSAMPASVAVAPAVASDSRRAAPKPSTSPPKAPPLKRHWFGFHVAQDVAYVYGESVCQRELSEPPDAFWCFYPGSDDAPFFHDSQDDPENLEGGPTFATTRLLLSYDFAISERVSIGTRLGYAFGGGPPADQHPVQTIPSQDRNLLPPGTPGLGGNPFLPFHAELRANYWILPLTNRWFRAYVGASFGVAQVDSKHSVSVVDCADPDAMQNSASATFEGCVLNEDFSGTIAPITLDAWNNLGRGFVAANAGGAIPLTSALAVVLNVNAMYMFPQSGFVLEPSLGVMTSAWINE